MALDKEALYGQFLASFQRREKLADLATRKALDLPAEDDVNITTTHNGLQLRHLAGIALMVLLSGTLGGGLTALLGSLGHNASGILPPAAATPAESAPAGAAVPPAQPQQFKVTFYGEDGQPIEVQQK
jgi:hypothetical protein